MNQVKRKVFVLAALLAMLIFCDTLRSPENQLSAQTYVGIVHTYQRDISPLLKGLVACRYNPTCSQYSIEAVQQYGIWRGLFLSIKRLASCTSDVAMGTVDTVP